MNGRSLPRRGMRVASSFCLSRHGDSCVLAEEQNEI